MRSMMTRTLVLLAVSFIQTGYAQNQRDAPARPPLTVLNAGVGGNNTRNGLARMDRDVIAKEPDLCFIAFGMNDAVNSRNHVPIDEFGKNLTKMAATCQKAGIRPVFITVNPCNEEKLYTRHKIDHYKPHGGANAMIVEYNRVIKNVAEDAGADVIDWHTEVMRRSGSSIDPGSVLRVDGVHLSPQGLAALARLAANWMTGADIPDGAVVVAFGDSITKQGWIDMARALYVRPPSDHPDSHERAP